jgi:hypothetical protein
MSSCASIWGGFAVGGDSAQMQQLAMNLIINGAEAMGIKTGPCW